MNLFYVNYKDLNFDVISNLKSRILFLNFFCIYSLLRGHF
jgi:hypothetical protein